MVVNGDIDGVALLYSQSAARKLSIDEDHLMNDTIRGTVLPLNQSGSCLPTQRLQGTTKERAKRTGCQAVKGINGRRNSNTEPTKPPAIC